MFEHLSTRQLLVKSMQESKEIRLALAKYRADIEYLAMMSDIELDEEEEENAEE